ncbi:hypothetical protein ACFQ34_10185, partial [Pseudonocardia benzenivorans]
MTEIGLILLGVIVVGGLVAFFMLRTTRGESPSDGPRTVGDLVRLKAESADRQDEPATAEQAPPPVPEPEAAAGAVDATPASAPTSAPAGASSDTAAVDTTADTATAATAGRGTAPAVTPAPSPRPRTQVPEPRTVTPLPAAARASETVEPVTVEPGDVSPPWGRIPDGSLVLPAVSEPVPDPDREQPDWRWLAPVGREKASPNRQKADRGGDGPGTGTAASAAPAAARSRPGTP